MQVTNPARVVAGLMAVVLISVGCTPPPVAAPTPRPTLRESPPAPTAAPASASDHARAAPTAQFAEMLKKSFWARGITVQDVARSTADRLAEDDAEDVRELRELMQKAATLSAAKR